MPESQDKRCIWKDKKNAIIQKASAMMKKTEFTECKRYLHVADNNALNSSNVLTKV